MASGVFVHAHTGRYEIFGFKGAVCDHAENIDDVVGQAVSAVVTALSGVVHIESSSGHLGDSVVDGFAGVDGGLQVGIFKGKHGSAGLCAFVTRADIDEDTEMDVGGDGD